MRLIDPWSNDHYGRRDTDVPAMQQALVSRGYWASKQAILEAWANYCESQSVGWLSPYQVDNTMSQHAINKLLEHLGVSDDTYKE